MKKLLFLMLFAFPFASKAQGDYEQNVPKNAIKINILAPFGLAYERAITERISLTLQYNRFRGSFNSSSLGDYKLKLTGWSLDLKYFPINSQIAPRGFYLAPYFKIYPLNVSGSKEEIKNGQTVKGGADVSSTIVGGGGMAGYQFIASSGFTIDIAAGGGFYSLGLKDIAFQYNDGTTKSYEIPKLLQFFSKTLAPRFVFSLGYAF